MKVKIRIHPKSGMTYFPDEIRDAGFIGEVEGIPNAFSILFIKPGASLESVLESLDIIKRDIKARMKYEPRTEPPKES